MPAPIIRTKLHIPYFASHELIARPRLSAQLSQGLARKLTLIAASAGSGKTALVCQWLQESDAAAAWLSLDDNDNDLTRFLRYLLAAIQQVEPQIGHELAQILQEAEHVVFERMLSELINEIDVTVDVDRKLILILDDYHAITNATIHEALRYLLDHLPRSLHLILTTRVDPPLPLGRMRVKRQLLEIRSTDLRFRPEELHLYLAQVMQIDLSPTAIQQLEERTEGWIAGAQLAGLSLQGQNPVEIDQLLADLTGSDRYIADYLIEEVLQRQSPEVRTFLLQTSIVETLSPGLCDAITIRTDSRDLLITLEAENFFLIPLDNGRQWYRYHHLFQELLRAQLQFQQSAQQSVQQTASPQSATLPQLHQRASDWYAAQNRIADALHHAFAADDLVRAQQLIETHAFPMVLSGNVRQPLAWLKRLPDEVVYQSPLLCLTYAWIMTFTTQVDQFERFLQPAEAVLIKSYQADDPWVRNLRLQIDMLRVFAALQRGDAQRGLIEGEQILARIPIQETRLRATALLMLADGYYTQGRITDVNRVLTQSIPLFQASDAFSLTMLVTGGLVQAQMIQGELRLAEQTCRRLLAWAEENEWQNSPALAFLYVHLGELHREWDQLDQAEEYLTEALRLAELSGLIPAIEDGYLALTRLRMGQRDWQGATAALEKAKASRQGSYLPSAVLLNAYQLILWLRTGAIDLAQAYVRQSGLTLADEPDSFHEAEYLALCRWGIEQGHFADVLALLAKLKVLSVADNRVTRVMENLLLQAITLHRQQEVEHAVNVLAEALQLAQPVGYRRRFVDEEEPILFLLRQAAAQGIEADYVATLLQATQDKTATDVVQPLVEPLSERELEILRLVAAGLKNKEIASDLIISVNTVLYHTKNIYGKLGVNKRTLAVAKATELGLL